MPAFTLQLKPADIARFTNSIAEKQMRKTAKAVSVLQLELVAEAFDRQGQPSKPWPKMWADKHTFEIPAKRKGIAEKAMISAAKAEAAFDRVNRELFPKESRIAAAQAKLDKARANLKNKLDAAQPATSYRRGGERLRDNGQLAKSFFKKSQTVEGKDLTCVVASSAFYAVYHQNGFKTTGPNFIPLTIKARRTHVKGNDPKLEGLEEGVDYIMAWKGVTVPESPMIDYADPIVKQKINATITEAFFNGA